MGWLAAPFARRGESVADVGVGERRFGPTTPATRAAGPGAGGVKVGRTARPPSQVGPMRHSLGPGGWRVRPAGRATALRPRLVGSKRHSLGPGGWRVRPAG